MMVRRRCSASVSTGASFGCVVKVYFRRERDRNHTSGAVPADCASLAHLLTSYGVTEVTFETGYFVSRLYFLST